MDLEDIELYCNLDFDPDMKKKYENIIIDIFNNFNNMCPDNNNQDNPDIMVIVALYYISKKEFTTAINILLEAINNNYNYNISCTLGIILNILNKKEDSIKYFKLGADNNHILSATNLAYEYLCQGNRDLYFYYNNIGLINNDENAQINKAIYLWNFKKDIISAEEIFNNLSNNYRAYYEHAKLISDINKKKELLMKAIQLKPKKPYIDMLISLTGDYERNLLYKKYNININKLINIDNSITIRYLENDISRYSRCPTCYNNITSNIKTELFKLKCNHSLCNDCIIKYCKNNCCICYK
jgi:hypothetical protein